MADILDKLQQIKVDLELSVQGEKILDIVYYGTINLSKNDADLENETKEDIYLIKKEKDGNIEFEFHTNNGIIATVGEGNVITISENYKDKINDKEFFIQLAKANPISLQKLEQIRKQDKSIKDDLENNTLEQDKQNSKEVEIDLNKKVTADMTFADLVPEVRKKGIKQVKVRRIDSTKFEFYGIDAGRTRSCNRVIKIHRRNKSK